MSRSAIWIAASFLLAFALLAVLFKVFKAQPQNVLDAATAVPPTVVLFVAVLSFANQLVGAMKWRISLRELSPDAKSISLFNMSEATAFGALFGQFLPPQISAAAARWAYSRQTHRAGAVVGSTLFEQLFDFVVLLAAAFSGLAILGFGYQGIIAAFYFVLLAAGALAAVRIGLKGIGAALHRSSSDSLRALADAVLRAGSMSATNLLQLTGLSIIRLILVGLRACLIVIAIFPEIDPVVIALGYPVTGLAMAIPIVPAGIGAAEWTWTGLMVLAGAAAAPAAAASVVVRLINMIALAIVLIGFGVLRLFRRALN
ncbi:MAG: lysylphosphatidylglycerol synthase transmembrane domain-containing protein [Boseongicola sp.]